MTTKDTRNRDEDACPVCEFGDRRVRHTTPQGIECSYDDSAYGALRASLRYSEPHERVAVEWSRYRFSAVNAASLSVKMVDPDTDFVAAVIHEITGGYAPELATGEKLGVLAGETFQQAVRRTDRVLALGFGSTLIGKRVSWPADGMDHMGLVMATAAQAGEVHVQDDGGRLHQVPVDLLAVAEDQPSVNLSGGEVSVLLVALQQFRETGDRRFTCEQYAELEWKLNQLGAIAFGRELENR